MRKVLKSTSKAQFSMATGPAQRLLGDRNASTAAGAPGNHMVSALIDAGPSGGSCVESCLPCHQTDVGRIQELMQELMNVYSIVGVSLVVSRSRSG